ncbi:MAG TPA: glycoside hydrolase family 30 beta sandwich domain-containing protein, partial [Polyangiaceae bacterium]|nr:glycoside hydrolase family 30 beta sandwich domain-containing protein [Polyangiaceae bacterium]
SSGSSTGSSGSTTGTGTGSTGSATGSAGSATGSTGSDAGSGSSGSSGSQSTGPILITSGPGAYWTTATPTAGTGTATVTVGSTAAQTFQGFGGAFNEDGWVNLQKLSASDQAKAIDLLFGADAAHFVFGRIPIGASDYATSRYTDDEVMSGTDNSLTSFSITRDMTDLIPYVKAAMGVNSSLTFWGSPWTPPTWMKTTSGSANGNSCALVGSTMFDGGCMNNVTANLTTYGQYFVKWIQAYKAQGITISMVSPQNEPNYAEGYPSCLWDASLYTTFVGQYLGPALSGASLSTEIMLGTNSNGDSGQDPAVVSAVEANSTAKGLCKVIGLQWGMLDNFESNPSSFTTYGIPIWATEHKCGNYPWMTTVTAATATVPQIAAYDATMAPNDQAYGVESWAYIRNAIKAGVSTYNAWNMVLDPIGKGNDTVRSWNQDALLVVNNGALVITPAYYAFRHVSQYVQPGAVVMGTTGGDALAFKNPDGSIVTVMYNSGSSAAMTTLSVGGKTVQFSIPANGWATYKNQ